MDRLFSLTRCSSELTQEYFPPIQLDPCSNYVMGLYSLNTYHSIPNVISGINNQFHYLYKGAINVITIEEGCYELDDIVDYLNETIYKTTGDGTAIQIETSARTFKVKFYCLYTVFMTANSIGSILGFSEGVLNAKMWHKSNLPVQISRIAEINVECNLIDGSYRDGKPCHTIYSFFPRVDPGHKISEHPTRPLYFNVTTNTISLISLRITDQRGRLVDFKGEEISIQLNLKKLT